MKKLLKVKKWGALHTLPGVKTVKGLLLVAGHHSTGFGQAQAKRL
jgi:hypothetical protein